MAPQPRVLSRYERTEDGRVIIDVAAARVEELYNNFDKGAPFIRRDLDQDLVDYLIGCARELHRSPFVLRFTLGEPPDGEKQSRIRRSVNAYFLYLADVEREHVGQMFRRATILFCIGLAILFVSIYVNRALGEARSVVGNVFAEGLTVAAWVSLWESLATVLIEWAPHRRKVRVFRRLACAEVIFRRPTGGAAA